MLEIINNLEPFFEDCYRRINVREYAKLIKISPPTSSKLLHLYHKSGILKKDYYKNYLLFYSNNKNKTFIDLSRLYWSIKFESFLNYLNIKLINPTVILFGSLAKAETKKDSDIDIAVFAHKKEINLKNFEKKFSRKVQIFWFNSIKKIKNRELANNIINGYVLTGKIRL